MVNVDLRSGLGNVNHVGWTLLVVIFFSRKPVILSYALLPVVALGLTRSFQANLILRAVIDGLCRKRNMGAWSLERASSNNVYPRTT